MNNYIMVYLLKIKLYVSKVYRYAKSYLFSVSRVNIVDKNNNIRTITFRFLIVKLMTKFINILIRIRNKLDYEIHKAEIVRNHTNGNSSIIVCPKTINKDNLTISDLTNFINSTNDKKDDTMDKCIFVKFEIDCPKFGKINLKEYLITYKDFDGNYSHTLKNILQFNNYDVSTDAEINIKIFNSGKLVAQSYKFDKVGDVHISKFHDINSLEI